MSDKPEKQRFREFLLDEGKKWAARMAFMGLAAGLLIVLTPLKDRALAIWHTPERLGEIAQKLDQLAGAVSTLTGADRVTRQPEDMSYVKEPAYFGEPIILVMFIGRTEIGAACVLREFIAQFTDENNVTLAGESRQPKVQLSAEVVRRIVRLNQPDGLIAGRTRVQLQMEYVCGDQTVFELTKPVFYYARAKE